MSGVVIDDAVRFGARYCLLLGGLAKGWDRGVVTTPFNLQQREIGGA